jgi:hypothetical protein
LRWSEDVGEDMWEMKVKRWRHKVVDREDWAFEEAKGVREP